MLSALVSMKRCEEIVCISENLFTNRKLRLERCALGPVILKKLSQHKMLNKTKLSAVMELCNLES